MIFGFCDQCHAILQQDGSGHFPDCAIVTAIAQSIIEEITVSVPTVNDYDWGTIEAEAVVRLTQPKTPPPPPEPFIRLAQESYVGRVNQANPEGERLHNFRYDFGTQERAARAAGHLKTAGLYTTPKTSVRVIVDPDKLATPEGRLKYRERTGSMLSDEELKDLGGRTLGWKANARKGPRT